MTKTILKPTDKTYSGKYTTYRGKDYQFIPEQMQGYCRGCALEDRTPRGCPASITDNCRQGFILKEVK